MSFFQDRNQPPEDDKVLSFRLWCQLNNFSASTGHRLRKTGQGPNFIRVSERRFGVTVGENRRWRNSRATA